MSRTTSPTQARVDQLEDAIRRLLGALDKQTFPNGPPGGPRCAYSMNVEEAMQKARKLVPTSKSLPDERDLARPKGTP